MLKYPRNARKHRFLASGGGMRHVCRLGYAAVIFLTVSGVYLVGLAIGVTAVERRGRSRTALARMGYGCLAV